MTFTQKYKIPSIGTKFGDWVVQGQHLQSIQNGTRNNKIKYAKGIAVACAHETHRVHKDVNMLKRGVGQNEFIELCLLVAQHHITLKGNNYEGK